VKICRLKYLDGSESKDWYVDYTVLGRRHRVRVGPKKSHAETVLAEIKTRMARGELGDLLPQVRKAKRTLFNDFAKEYEEKTVFQYRASTRRTNGPRFRILTTFFGPHRLDEINTDLVETFRRKRHAAGAKPGTINRDFALLRRMLNIAYDWALLRQKPDLRIKGLKEAPREFTPPTPQDLEKLLDACGRSRNKDLRDIALTALFTGMRLSEVLHLQWSDINMPRNEVRVVSRETHMTKSNRSRSVPLNPRLKEALQRRRRGEDAEYVFVGRDRKPYGDIKHGWSEARKKAGMPRFRFHDLRCTWASYLVMNGTPLRLVQDLGGWQSLAMVQRYSHLRPEQRVDAIESLNFGDGVKDPVPSYSKAAKILPLRRRPRAAQ
jgi:integrase